MYGVELYLKVCMAMLRDRLNQRETARRFGVDCGTVAKLAGRTAGSTLRTSSRSVTAHLAGILGSGGLDLGGGL